MRKRQWRFLLNEILDARNAHEAYHAFLANRIEELRVKENTILAKLEVMQNQLEDALVAQTGDPEKRNIDLRTVEIMPDGTVRECEE